MVLQPQPGLSQSEQSESSCPQQYESSDQQQYESSGSQQLGFVNDSHCQTDSQ